MKTFILKQRHLLQAIEKSNARKKLAKKEKKRKEKKEQMFMKKMNILTLILVFLVNTDSVFTISQMVVELKGDEITILVFLFLLILLLYTSCSFIWSFLLWSFLFYLSYLYQITNSTIFFDLYGLQMKKIVWEVEELFLIYDQILLSFGFDITTMEKLSLMEVKGSLILASRSPEELKDQIFAYWSEISKPPSPYDWELIIDWKWIIEYLRGKLGPPLINRLCFGVGWFFWFQLEGVYRYAFLMDLGLFLQNWNKGIFFENWNKEVQGEPIFIPLLRYICPYTIHNSWIFPHLRSGW